VIKGKAAGQSARAKAAYNLRVQEYAANRHVLAYVASGNMPAWADDALGYWEATDTHERAKATLFREVEFALPHELPAAERHRLAHEFMASICDAQGLPYLLTVHEKPGNSQAHGLISERMHDGYDRLRRRGSGGRHQERNRLPAGPEGPTWPRRVLASVHQVNLVGHVNNPGAARRGCEIDHRSFADQGIKTACPAIHVRPHVGAMEARGIRTSAERWPWNRRDEPRIEALEQELRHGHDLGSDQGREVSRPGGPGAGAPVPGPGADRDDFRDSTLKASSSPWSSPELDPAQASAAGEWLAPRRRHQGMDGRGQDAEGSAQKPAQWWRSAGGPGVQWKRTVFTGLIAGLMERPSRSDSCCGATRPGVNATGEHRPGPLVELMKEEGWQVGTKPARK
jgi:hypothetical protein